MKAFVSALTLFATVLTAALLGPSASAQNAAAITASNGWILAGPPSATTLSGYVTLNNSAAAADRLLAISSPIAARSAMHEMTMNGSMMSMRDLPYGVTVPAHGAYTFSMSGTHIMFYNPTRAVRVGETIPVRLTFLHAGVVDTTLVVRAHP